ncbi:VOC family protein [Gluconacetobacter azotocaptans]|uniref:VOC family protein n=1 Tax=Gluconacetobacter azotocaptans TaxID=142834 RepID=A0A7W4JU88_9PROT|nr:VOC family protein [Gluconacetobacter azotocaptans]MBB2191031.1 VOC family protein [Gluconacetobacter azotocaptans]MBM9401952.1 VOC family protein [Gluconacetobacter azotocaptans]
MFSHVTVGVRDVTHAAIFYDAVLAPLGIVRCWTAQDGSFAGWRQPDGREGDNTFFIGRPFDGQPPAPGNGWMCAFTAPDHAAVQAAYDAALAHGGADAGAPGPRPHYGPHYFGAYMRDPDGNKLHVVCRAPCP